MGWHAAGVAQLVARCADNAKVPGSSPGARNFFKPIFGTKMFYKIFRGLKLFLFQKFVFLRNNKKEGRACQSQVQPRATLTANVRR
jgi:hypothetical protein